MIWCVYAAVHSWAAWKSIKCWQDVAGCLAEPRLQWAGAEILNPHLHICKPHLSHVYIIIMNWNYIYIADIADFCGCLTGCDFSLWFFPHIQGLKSNQGSHVISHVIRNVSNPDGGSSLVNLRVALLEVTLKPGAKFSFFDSRFFRNGSILIEQISATSITCDPWLLLNPWMWGKNLKIYKNQHHFEQVIAIFHVFCSSAPEPQEFSRIEDFCCNQGQKEQWLGTISNSGSFTSSRRRLLTLSAVLVWPVMFDDVSCCSPSDILTL